MSFISFKTWLAEQMLDPKMNAAQKMAVQAAANAVKKGQSPVVAAKNQVMTSVQNGQVALKDMGKIMPTDDNEQVSGQTIRRMKKK